MMKKILSIVLLFLLIAALLLPASAAQKRQLLVDDAGLLSDEAAEKVEATLEEYSDALDFDIVIVTTTDLGTKSTMEYADDFYDYNGYGEGRQGDRSGALLLVYDKGYGSERWISTRGYGIKAYTDYGIQAAGNQLRPLMEDDEWEASFMLYAKITKNYVESAKAGHPVKKPQDVGKGVIISAIVSLVIALIITSMVKKSYKPVSFKANASDYLVQGSLQLTGSADRFRTTSVSRTERQSSSGGSSTHRSSSGATHGGGGF